MIEYSKKFCIGFIPDFTYGDYLYLHEIDKVPKHYHQIYIKKKEPRIILTSPMRLLKEKLIKPPNIFFDKILVPRIQEKFQVVAQLLRIYVWNQQNQKKYNMIIARESAKNILVMLIFQCFVMLFISFLNWVLIFWKME